MDERWISAACPTPAAAFLHFQQSRLSALGAALLQSSDSIQRIEKYMKGAEEVDGQVVEEALLFDTLHRQLTALQVQCLEERRNYLTLLGQKEQLQLESQDLRRKFTAAMLLGRIDEKAVSHFLQKNPKAPHLTDQIIHLTEEMNNCDGEKRSKYDLRNPGVLAQQVAFLEKHLDEVKEQSFVELYTLKSSLKHAEEERDLIKTHYDSRLKDMAHRLQEARALLHKTAEENLTSQKKMMMAEEDWSKEHKDLVIRLSQVSDSPTVLPGTAHPSQYHVQKDKDIPALQKQLLEKLSRAEIQLLEKQNTLTEYEMKFLQMERKLQRMKHEEVETKRACLETVKKLKSKNETLESRFDKIDERRKLDNEGFRQDIKAVRQFVSTIEKKLHLFMYRRHQENVLPPPEDPVGKLTMTGRRQIGWVEGPGDSGPKSMKGALKVGVGRKIGGTVLTKVSSSDSSPPSCQFSKLEGSSNSSGDVERDRLVYEMLCKVLRSAQAQVDQLEEDVRAS